MSSGSWLKALCLALLVVIVTDIGFIVRADSLSREACFTLAAMTAVAGLVPVVFAVYLIRPARRTL
ncbi:MAG: hypothetical protein HY581_03595 [Nitrospirae bacterium]|nr:hypothetical protein [Nitrospirota bacterium]